MVAGSDLRPSWELGETTVTPLLTALSLCFPYGASLRLHRQRLCLPTPERDEGHSATPGSTHPRDALPVFHRQETQFGLNPAIGRKNDRAVAEGRFWSSPFW